MIRSFLLGAACALIAAPVFAQSHDSGHDEPLWNAADRYFDADVMAQARHDVLHHSGATKHSMLMLDRFEWQDADGETSLKWEGGVWTGGDINRLVMNVKGAYLPDEDSFDGGEVELLYSRAATRYFNVQTGLRHEFGPDETQGVIGIEGLAPYWFEVNAHAYLGGEAGAAIEAELEYEILFTQRLILQPVVETRFAFGDAPTLDQGTGFTDVEAGLRLRYEIRRQFAPYVGVSWERKLGETASLARSLGDEVEETALLAGVRIWF